MAQVVPLLVSSTSLPIYCSLITLPSDTIQTALLTASLNELQNKTEQSILLGISSEVSKVNETTLKSESLRQTFNNSSSKKHWIDTLLNQD